MRLLPHEFPPWQTAYHYFRLWRLDGTWEQLHRVLRDQAHWRNPQPTAGIEYHGMISEAAFRQWSVVAHHYLRRALLSGAVDEQLELLRTELNERPVEVRLPAALQAKLFGSYLLNAAFGVAGNRHNYALRAARVDPALILNRGLWSLALEGVPFRRRRQTRAAQEL